MRFSSLLLVAVALTAFPVQAQQVNCLAGHPKTADAIPDEILRNCAPPLVTVDALGPDDRAGVIHNNGAGNARVVTFLQNEATTLTVVAPQVNPSATAFINAADFAGDDLTTLYFLANENQFRSVNMTTGAVTTLPNATAPAAGQTYTGMGWDYLTSSMYVVSAASEAATLGVINLATGVVTTVAAITPAPSLLIDIAVHPQTGQIYGHDIGTDTIVLINKTTGALTTLGPTGLLANFGQGMDFDNEDNSLYLYAVNTDGGNSTGLYFVDLETGEAALVSPIGTALTQVGDGGSMTVRGGVATENGPEGSVAFLGAVGPNPAVAMANIAYSVRDAASVRLAVYDVLGREVAVIVDAEKAAGAHTASLNVSGFAPGVYVLRLSANDAVQVRTLTVAR